MTRRRRQNASPVSLFAFQDIVTSITVIILLIAMAMAIQVARAPAREKAGVDATEYGVLTTRLELTQQQIEEHRDAIKSMNTSIDETASIGPVGGESDLAKLAIESQRLTGLIASQREQLAVSDSKAATAEADLASLEANSRLAELDERLAETETKIKRLRQSNRILFNPPPGRIRQIMIAEILHDRVLLAAAGVSEKPIECLGANRTEDVLKQMRRTPRETHWVLFAHPGSTAALNEIRSELQKRGRSVGFDLLPDDVRVLDPVTGAK